MEGGNLVPVIYDFTFVIPDDNGFLIRITLTAKGEQEARAKVKALLCVHHGRTVVPYRLVSYRAISNL